VRRGPFLFLLSAGCSAGSAAESRAPDAFVLTAVDGSASDVGAAAPADATTGGSASDGGIDAPPSRFITEVVSFEPGTCAGFGQDAMPGIVYGPPVGGGTLAGSEDVVSLGGGGSMVVGFGPNAIVDGPGPDFIVFENPFWIGGNPDDIYAEPGEISVSEDGVTWTAFPCTDTTQAPPYGQCGGVHPVFSTPTNGISPFDVAHAGGDAYDLHDLGVTKAKYVRIRNIVSTESCPDAGSKPTKNGFDLDAIAILNPLLP